jgi:CheY-like chemotaxis protein
MRATNLADTGDATSTMSILIVDDEPDMRLLVRTVLSRGGIRVVGEAADGPEAISLVRELHPPPVPTVLLLDNRMPSLSGLEVAEQVLAWAPKQLIILFSAFLDRDTVAAATRAGVTACVSKQDVLKLPEIIRAVVAANA